MVDGVAVQAVSYKPCEPCKPCLPYIPIHWNGTSGVKRRPRLVAIIRVALLITLCRCHTVQLDVAIQREQKI